MKYGTQLLIKQVDSYLREILEMMFNQIGDFIKLVYKFSFFKKWVFWSKVTLFAPGNTNRTNHARNTENNRLFEQDIELDVALEIDLEIE
jgi:hypothetical protein